MDALAKNPVPKPKRPACPEKDNLRERILTENEEGRLLRASSEELRPMLVVALNTGMRLGEILPIRWSDVDFESMKIRIPKTKSGKIRYVNINSRFLATLQEHNARDGSLCFLFLNPQTGKPITTVKRAFKTACRRAGVSGLRFHDLRHTFASRLVRMGVDLITVKELLGHSTVTITERYTHKLQGQKQEAVDLLGRDKRTVGTVSPSFSYLVILKFLSLSSVLEAYLLLVIRIL